MLYNNLFNALDAMFSMDSLFDDPSEFAEALSSYGLPSYPPTEMTRFKDGTVKMDFTLYKFKKEDLDIKVDRNKLVVKTADDYQEPKPADDVLWTKSTFKTKPFTCGFVFTDQQDLDNLTAKFEDSILEITIPPKQKKEEKKITIA